MPESLKPPNGWRSTRAPVILRLTYRLPTRNARFTPAMCSGLRDGIDERPDRAARVLGGSDRHAARRLDQPGQKRVVNRLEHDGAGAGRALLTRVAEGAGGDTDHRFVQVGVAIDNDGVLAAH